VSLYVFRRDQYIPAPRERVFEFFSDPRNLETITPPFLRFRILDPAPERIARGTLIRYRLSLYGIPIRWVSEISGWRPPEAFTDVQLSGPYAFWKHTHTLTVEGEGTRMTDEVRYRPTRVLAGLVNALFVRRNVERIFDYRAARIQELFA
jgi:ligand-binding SRPBCC domain-containing protein